TKQLPARSSSPPPTILTPDENFFSLSRVPNRRKDSHVRFPRETDFAPLRCPWFLNIDRSPIGYHRSRLRIPQSWKYDHCRARAGSDDFGFWSRHPLDGSTLSDRPERPPYGSERNLCRFRPGTGHRSTTDSRPSAEPLPGLRGVFPRDHDHHSNPLR